MTSTMIEEFVFDVQFLGSISVGSDKDGIVVIQKVLKELYLKGVKKPGTVPRVQSRQLKIRPEGILMTFMDNHGQQRHVFYDLAAIKYYDAVKLVIRRASVKNNHAFFEPINKGVEKLKGYASLSRKQNHLLDIIHPPIFACIIKRLNKSKILDCYAFVIKSDEEAMHIVSLLERNKSLHQRSHRFNSSVSRRDSMSSTYRPTDNEIRPSSSLKLPRPRSAFNLHDPNHVSYEMEIDSAFPRQLQHTSASKDDDYLKPKTTDTDIHNYETNTLPFSSSDGSNKPHRRPIPDLNLDNFLNNHHKERLHIDVDSSPTYRGFSEHIHHSPLIRNLLGRTKTSDDINGNSETFNFSVSNLESRQNESKSLDADNISDKFKYKPIAKVPPHLVAAVKVLPTEFKNYSRKTPTELHDVDKLMHNPFQADGHGSNGRSLFEHKDMLSHAAGHIGSVLNNSDIRDLEVTNIAQKRDPHNHTAALEHRFRDHNKNRTKSTPVDLEFAAYVAKHEMVDNPYNLRSSDIELDWNHNQVLQQHRHISESQSSQLNTKASKGQKENMSHDDKSSSDGKTSASNKFCQDMLGIKPLSEKHEAMPINLNIHRSDDPNHTRDKDLESNRRGPKPLPRFQYPLKRDVKLRSDLEEHKVSQNFERTLGFYP